MSISSLRLEVLKCFKKLHRTRQLIFQGDDKTLQLARDTINSEFRKNKSITDGVQINELIDHGKQMEHELRTTIVQAKEVKPGVYNVRILPDTEKLDNIEYDESLIPKSPIKTNCKRCDEK